jgi:hypothetical protein
MDFVHAACKASGDKSQRAEFPLLQVLLRRIRVPRVGRRFAVLMMAGVVVFVLKP